MIAVVASPFLVSSKPKGHAESHQVLSFLSSKTKMALLFFTELCWYQKKIGSRTKFQLKDKEGYY